MRGKNCRRIRKAMLLAPPRLRRGVRKKLIESYRACSGDKARRDFWRLLDATIGEAADGRKGS